MSHDLDPALRQGNRKSLAGFTARHVRWSVQDRVGTIVLDRPERKNPLTFASYAELRDLFNGLAYADDVRAVVIHGAGGNFCSGGDVHDIIGPLIGLRAPDLLMFTRMTGDLVKAMRACPQPIIAAVDGVCLELGRSSRWPRTYGWAPRGARRRSCSPGSGWRAATWGRVRSCRA
jgi:1,4-dihydroxy-2-naphthoyl-CoA synthase